MGGQCGLGGPDGANDGRQEQERRDNNAIFFI